MPPMVGGIFYEHMHRMVASFVGLLTIVLALWLWRRDERRWMRVLGFVALGAVITQGVLGGLTVLFLLPTPISVSHATLAQTFFAFVLSIALFTSPWWRSEQHSLTVDTKRPSLVWLALLTTAAVYIQLILGALMRHTHSGLAVPDVPLAYGQFFPSLSTEALARYNETLIHSNVRLAADGSVTSDQIVIHMIHRYWAVVVTVMIVWLSFRLRSLSSAAPRIARFSYILLGLLVIQIALGFFTVLSLKAMEIATAHVAVGALLLGASVLTTLHAVKIFGIQFQKFSFSLSPKEMPA